ENLELREQNLLDDVPLLTEELRLERHRRLAIQPKHVPVAELVPGLYPQNLRLALRHARRLRQAERVMSLDVLGVARQRRHQRAHIPALLEEDDPTVRKDALHFLFLADDLASNAIQRYEPLADTSVLIAMDDVHGLGVAAQQMNERAFVAELLDGAAHAVDPAPLVLRARLEDGQSHCASADVDHRT